MSVVNEMRRGSPQTDRSNPRKGGSKFGMILLVVVALGAVGAAAYMYLNRGTNAVATGPTIGIAFTSDRLGKEIAAPLLPQCAKQGLNRASATEAAVNFYIRDKANELAECVFDQPAGALCDANNRSLAVVTALQLLRNTDPFVEAKSTGRSNSHAMVVRERVIGSIGRRARQGELIARDFGEFPPASLQAAFAPGAASNACAK